MTLRVLIELLNTCLDFPAKIGYPYSMDTEQTFDQEFNLEEITQKIVDKAKAEVKSRYGNKKRHRQ